MRDYNPLDTAAQAATQKQHELTARLAREIEEGDTKWLMSSKRGRRIIWRLLDLSGVFRLSFNTSAMQMAFNEGYRSFGNRTLALVHQHCSEQYHTMIKENVDGKPDRHGGRPNQ